MAAGRFLFDITGLWSRVAPAMPRAKQFLVAALFMLAVATPGEAEGWLSGEAPTATASPVSPSGIQNGPLDGPKVAWKAEVGLGFSSVVIANRRLFTLGHADEQDTVYGLDATTGKVLWKHSYPAELGDKFFEGGTTGTPTVAGDRVYVLSRWGDMLCLGASDGKVQWSKNVQQETESRPPDWGFAGAPLVLGDRVYLNVGEAGLALNAPKDGSIVSELKAREGRVFDSVAASGRR